jgi:hypothetical protein
VFFFSARAILRPPPLHLFVKIWPPSIRLCCQQLALDPAEMILNDSDDVRPRQAQVDRDMEGQPPAS